VGDIVLGVLIAALALAFTFVYAGTITPKHIRANDWPEAHGLEEGDLTKMKPRACKALLAFSRLKALSGTLTVVTD
jgi:hypothetical protein